MALAATLRCAYSFRSTRSGTAVVQARLLSLRMPVTHVIFDFDGLLVDTEACYTIANQTMLRKFGREYTKELNAKMMGRKEDEAFTWLLKEVGIDDKITVKEYLAQYDVMLEGMFLKCKALPGAERLVRHLAKKDVPMAICSGSRGSTFASRREPHKDWLDLIKLMVCRIQQLHMRQNEWESCGAYHH
ncbi:Pseudouridine-5'-monophosphatase [Trichostrongylus colubriformis]|uniref:Pseudouridine-5'-monophosphatase n=1 Tax=Trichostrongylus colubriformis TaxID=6319 RepID=A0AAN8IKD0_TRICO